MKNKLVIGLAALLGVGGFTGVKAQSVSDDALLAHGSVLEKFTPGNYSIQLNGEGRSDIERSVKVALKEMFNGELNKDDYKFLMSTSGNCIVDAIDQLVSKGKAVDGDSVTFVYGGNNVVVYNNRTPSVSVKSDCNVNLGELVAKYRALQSAQLEESANEQGSFVQGSTNIKSKNGKSKSVSLQDPRAITYSSKMAKKFSENAEEFLKAGKYDLAVYVANTAAGLDKSYEGLASVVCDKAASFYHSESDKFFKKADGAINKGNIEDAVENLNESYKLEKRAIELNGKQSLTEEDALKIRIGDYVIAQVVKLQDLGKHDKAYKLMQGIVSLGFTGDQLRKSYDDAAKSLK